MDRRRHGHWVWLWLAGFVMVILLGVLIWQPMLQGMADFLVIASNPEHADVLIVLGGELLGERTKKAVNLYQEGMAEVLLFSDGTDLSWRTQAADEMVALAQVLGVPQEAVIVERNSRSTYENAWYTLRVIEEHGWESAVVVTTDWHTRRSRFIFEQVYAGSGIRLSYAGAADPRFDSLEDWWRDAEMQQVVLTEWAKLVVYWLKWGI